MPWTLFDTSLGTCGLAWSDAGVIGLQLPEETRESTRERLLARTADAGPRATARSIPAWVATAIESARAHLDGRPQDLSDVPIDLSRVTPFVGKVYRALQRVPAGSTVTYGELARAVGSPGASRAVGRAMATNPFPLLVPCQRVLASAGKPGGFSAWGGVATKERILALEGRRPAETSLFAAERSDALPYDPVEARRHLVAADPVLGRHIDRIGELTLTLKSTAGTFPALAESIVYQQLNGKAAATIFGRVRALVPNGRALAPDALLALSDDALRAAGLSRNKLASIRDLAARASAGTVPTLAQLGRMDDEAIVEALTEVRGIGRWTVEMLLIFRLGRPDVLPLADYGVKKGFARVFHRGARRDELPTAAELARRGERWRPFRSAASWYLWRAADG
ncbi:MAG: methylated-DNA--[protein]-cysteine S-methyltransferase [Labilithrix sp.]|nr:methylated-DNA--[protein]-cysteine S-methyltransferase [Labilithrix sp.]